MVKSFNIAQGQKRNMEGLFSIYKMNAMEKDRDKMSCQFNPLAS
jgi:hypothetical protein